MHVYLVTTGMSVWYVCLCKGVYSVSVCVGVWYMHVYVVTTGMCVGMCVCVRVYTV